MQDVAPGTLLLDAARAAGAALGAPCGGAGTCGKCRVRIVQGLVGAPTADERALLTEAELQRGVRLACRCRVLGAATVEIEETATVESDVLGAGVMGDFRRDRVPGDGRPALGVAVDIGTTTVAVGLIDLRSGAELAAGTALNPQTAFGHDVLSRVRYAVQAEHRGELARVIRACVDRITGEACRDAAQRRDDIRRYVVAGNTAMTHLLLDLEVSGLGRAPYEPTAAAPPPRPAAALGWAASEGAEVFCVPAVSAFVGGDIVAGLLATGLPDRERIGLLVDMGTNGEVVLGSRDGLWACSCAAGPAFEGMGISCGMRAAPGAIDAARVVDGAVSPATIGGGQPLGLCGSGVIDVAAALLEAGVVEPSGRFARAAEGRPWAALLRDGPRRYVLSATGAREISFSQGDVRQVQLAKGAIASGIAALLGAAGIDARRVARLLIAGQFGHHVRRESLVALGLVPYELEDRVEVVGNTSKSGAVMCLLSRAQRARAATVAGGVRHVELSTLPRFERLLAEKMAFPSRGQAGAERHPRELVKRAPAPVRS